MIYFSSRIPYCVNCLNWKYSLISFSCYSKFSWFSICTNSIPTTKFINFKNLSFSYIFSISKFIHILNFFIVLNRLRQWFQLIRKGFYIGTFYWIIKYLSCWCIICRARGCTCTEWIIFIQCFSTTFISRTWVCDWIRICCFLSIVGFLTDSRFSFCGI